VDAPRGEVTARGLCVDRSELDDAEGELRRFSD